MASIKLITLVVYLSMYIKGEAAPLAQTSTSMIPKIKLVVHDIHQGKEFGIDGYRLDYQTSDGSYREEIGLLLEEGTPFARFVVKGSFGYVDQGIQTITTFTADSRGYRAKVQLLSNVSSPTFPKLPTRPFAHAFALPAFVEGMKEEISHPAQPEFIPVKLLQNLA